MMSERNENVFGGKPDDRQAGANGMSDYNHPPTVSGYVLDDDDWYIRPLHDGELLPTFFHRGFVNDGKVYLHDPEFDPDKTEALK